MNKIVYAGNIHGLLNRKLSGCFAVIVPAEHGKGGEIVWEKDGCKNKITFTADDVIVAPSTITYNISLHTPEDCYGVLIERALLPFKDVTVVSDDKNRGILHAVKQAETYLNGKQNKNELILTALGGLIAGYLTAFAATDGFSPVTRLILADIEKNIPNTAYSLEDFLKNMPLNYDYVRKVFKREIGVTPHDYLLHRRMELAAALISSGISNKYSEYSMSQIAELCGFADSLYFSRVFKKTFGVPPGGYGQ